MKRSTALAIIERYKHESAEVILSALELEYSGGDDSWKEIWESEEEEELEHLPVRAFWDAVNYSSLCRQLRLAQRVNPLFNSPWAPSIWGSSDEHPGDTCSASMMIQVVP